GLQRIDPRFLEQYVPFRPADPYRPEHIDRLQTALKNLPFFRSVHVDLGSVPDVSGLIPVTIRVVEKPPEIQTLMLSGSGLVGTVVLGLTAVALAMSTLAGAAAFPSWQRYRRPLAAGTIALLLACALLAVQRLWYLAAV